MGRTASKKSASKRIYTSVEICAGAGGQALGLEQAGFDHVALVEIDSDACSTLRLNRPNWNVIEADVRQFSGTGYGNIDLFAGGVPCPPFSVAGKQLGANDERDLFPEALRIVKEMNPRAVLLENVKGLLSPRFADYRKNLDDQFDAIGYQTFWKLLFASDHGVSQLRPRVNLVAIKKEIAPFFKWPRSASKKPKSIGDLLGQEMGAKGWKHVNKWSEEASGIAPTLVGGSKKHGGPDLGPSRAKEDWAKLGVNGSSVADSAPDKDFEGRPRLTVRMAAMVQGFPSTWEFSGRKTSAYRQVGNAFPPPVAKAVGKQIIAALAAFDKKAGKPKE